MMFFDSLKKRALPLLLSLSILLSAVLLPSCYGGAPETTDKDTLYENVSYGSQKSYDYVSDYLRYWGFAGYDADKLKSVEYVFHSLYYKDLGDRLDLAERTALDFLDNRFDDTDMSDMTAYTDALIKSFITAVGDKYAYYRTKDEFAAFEESMSGSTTGIGVFITMNTEENTIEVLDFPISSAAETAGILVGDFIVGVDGVSIEEVGAEALADLIRGEIGSSVSVTVLRDGQRISYEMKRIQIEETSVSYELFDDGIAYVYISQFLDNTDEQFKEAIDELEELGVKGYIFDLRFNPGGYFVTAVNLISYLVPIGTRVVASIDRDSEYWYYSDDSHVLNRPCVVICNGSTASAGELFTAAVRDYRDMGLIDAVIVGETTYGKGLVQSSYSLRDGSVLTFTTSYYSPPSAVNYDGVGIVPDITVEYVPDPERDNQFDAAYEEILKLINK